MYRMYGIPRVHGCTGAGHVRMYGIPRVHGCTGAGHVRMYGIPRVHGLMYTSAGLPGKVSPGLVSAAGMRSATSTGAGHVRMYGRKMLLHFRHSRLDLQGRRKCSRVVGTTLAHGVRTPRVHGLMNTSAGLPGKVSPGLVSAAGLRSATSTGRQFSLHPWRVSEEYLNNQTHRSFAMPYRT